MHLGARRATPTTGYPRYTIDVDGQPTAIIATGTETGGGPAHDEVERLLTDLYGTPTPQPVAAATRPHTRTSSQP